MTFFLDFLKSASPHPNLPLPCLCTLPYMLREAHLPERPSTSWRRLLEAETNHQRDRGRLLGYCRILSWMHQQIERQRRGSLFLYLCPQAMVAKSGPS